MSHIVKIAFRHVICCTSQFKRFYDHKITKNSVKEHNIFIIYFTQVEALIFFQTQKQVQQIVEYSVKIFQYLTFFSDITWLLFFSLLFGVQLKKIFFKGD